MIEVSESVVELLSLLSSLSSARCICTLLPFFVSSLLRSWLAEKQSSECCKASVYSQHRSLIVVLSTLLHFIPCLDFSTAGSGYFKYLGKGFLALISISPLSQCCLRTVHPCVELLGCITTELDVRIELAV